MSERRSLLAPGIVLGLSLAWGSWLAASLSTMEPARGTISGVVVAEESGAPLAEARVVIAPEGPGGGRPVVCYTDEEGRFHAAALPVGSYRISASSRVHSMAASRVELAEGKSLSLRLELSPRTPFLEFSAHQKVVCSGEQVNLTCHGFLRSDTVRLWRYEVDLAGIITDPEQTISSIVNRINFRDSLPRGNPYLKLLGKREVRISTRGAEGDFHETITLPAMRPGMYVLCAEADGLVDADYVMVSDLGLVAKHAGRELLLYAVNLKDGKPARGARITCFVSGAAVAQGRTGADGLVRVRLPETLRAESLVVIGERGSSVAVLSSYYGMAPEDEAAIYFYTDRPIYRPGDTVRYNIIVRLRAGERYVVPAGEDVTVSVTDWRETKVHEKRGKLDSYGSIHGEFTLSSEALTGYYTVDIRMGAHRQRAGLQVAEYRKPEFEVAVEPERERYTRGETARVAVRAEYYFGVPVSGARAEYTVLRAPLWGMWPEGEGYYEEQQAGDVVATGTVTLDAYGRAEISIPTAGKVEREELGEQAQRFSVYVDVYDASRKYASGEGSFLVTQGEFYIALKPETMVARAGEAVAVALTCKDYEGRVQAGVSVRVVAELEDWVSGEFVYTKVAEEKLVTDEKGRAQFTLPASRQGYYRIRASARDRLGNTVSGTAYVWATGAKFARLAYGYPEIELVPDKEVYEVGDRAQVLINTSEAGAVALVAIEGAKLERAWVQELRANSTVIEFDIEERYLPNVYLSACYVAGREFVSQTKEIKVSRKPHKLNIAVRSDREVYAPGDVAVYTITTTDAAGRPKPARVSLAVVDEAIFALAPERAEDIVDFFYARRENAVRTQYSFPPIYLGNGDKAGAKISVRKWFPDTAFWSATLETGAEGRVRVRVKIPDTLTTWRATVRGYTKNTAVGASVHKVRCTKDFLVRLELPRFATQRDRLTIAAVVHNNTSERQRATVTLDAPKLNIRAKATRRVTVPAQGWTRVDWPAEVPGVGEAKIRVFARAESGLEDAMELTLPIVPHGRRAHTSFSGATRTAAEERLTVRRDIVPGTAQARVALAPTVLGPVFGALEYLARYPYGCTEQTMSAFLPDVVVAQALRELGRRDGNLERKLDDMVRAGLARLYRFQHDDGGWGWWRYDESDCWMTAYVLAGLTLAQRAGYRVNSVVLASASRCARWLGEEARKKKQLDEAAFAAWALSLRGEGKQFLLKVMDELEARRSPYGWALAVAALAELGEEDAARAAMELLWREAVDSGGLIHWRESRGRHWRSEYEVTAVALKAALAATPEDGRVARVVRWLLAERRGEHWLSTRDTAWAIYALADYVRQTGELQPEFDFRVLLDGKEIARGHMGPEQAFAPEIVVNVPREALAPGTEHMLRVEKEGRGMLYYSVTLEQVVELKTLAATLSGSGIAAERAYYVMRPEYDEKLKQTRFAPASEPTLRFESGQTVRVVLTVRAPEALEYMMIEEPIPAGCEVSVRENLDPWEWEWWYSDRVVRDEKIVFFARRLPEGEQRIEYELRPEIPGTYHAMPTEVYGMYDPRVRGAGAISVVEISD